MRSVYGSGGYRKIVEISFARSHRDQVVEGCASRPFDEIHHLAMVASAPLTASNREGVSPFMGLIWTH
jgi:hypothetical protein